MKLNISDLFSQQVKLFPTSLSGILWQLILFQHVCIQNLFVDRRFKKNKGRLLLCEILSDVYFLHYLMIQCWICKIFLQLQHEIPPYECDHYSLPTHCWDKKNSSFMMNGRRIYQAQVTFHEVRTDVSDCQIKVIFTINLLLLAKATHCSLTLHRLLLRFSVV